MENCKCWELQPKATYVGEYHGCKIYRNKQICNGTKEREECSCDGDESKCNFYPEKRKENKNMNTAEMWIKAQEDGKTYKCNGMQYNRKKGFHGPTIGLWPAKAFDYVDDIFNLDWQLKPDNEMTKSEAEAKFNIKIVGD